MKRILLAGALIAVCLSLAAYGTAAYFTAVGAAENTITAGNINIALLETTVPEGSGDPVPFEDLSGVMPGDNASKIVQVKNTGSHPAYIRIHLDTTIRLEDGAEGEPDATLIRMNINTKAWTEKDGYYYYNSALQAGETTEPLFTKVSFSSQMNNLYQNSQAVITARAAAVQSENNGATALEAVGWPAE